MSYNKEWLDAAYDNFEEAILKCDVHLAKDIIADTFDAGFPEQARAMANELRRVDFINGDNDLGHAWKHSDCSIKFLNRWHYRYNIFVG